MANDDSKSEGSRAAAAPKAPAHTHEWTHDDVEPTFPPVSVSTCTCGAIRRSWQADDGEFHEEISYLS
jgi:hypothetical protein